MIRVLLDGVWLRSHAVRSIPDTVAAGDLDELIRLVDGLSAAGDWDGLVDVRDRCRHALETRGLQLWPAAEYAEYRLALDSPAPYACDVVTEEAGRFALGPLWEVAAGRLGWSDLSPHLAAGPARSLAAHERVLRGEDLTGDGSIDDHVLEIPLVLASWEPDYRTASYHSDRVDFDAPSPPPMADRALPATADLIDDDQSIEALLDVGAIWSHQSNGSARAVAVQGSADHAIAALGHDRCRAAPVDAAAALRLLAWAGADGGAYGRRRGSPIGRFAAWWVIGALSDAEWPMTGAQAEAAAMRMRWTVWEPAGFTGGWAACVAVESPEDGLSWALEALDSWREGDEPE